jgi:uncharacterized membrane protein
MNFNPIWVKFGVKDGQVIQSRDCRFNKEGRSGRHTLPKDRNDVVDVFYTFLSDLNKIR